MTPFNPENKDVLTMAEVLDPAMKITDLEDAKQYKAAYIAYLEQFPVDTKYKHRMTPEQIANANLGYYAGYYSNEVRERVERLFDCAHPVFGSIAENGVPTAEQAFEMGKMLAITTKNVNL